MQPRIHVLTLAVSALDRALAFYRDGLSLESAGIVGTEFDGDAKRISPHSLRHTVDLRSLR